MKHVLGGTLLVAGTSIGAGMLALPVVTAAAGFIPAFFVYLLCWAFMTCTGLLLLELCLKLPPDANLVTMASTYLGKVGKGVAWALYLFLFYCLSVAYISGGSGLLQSWLGGEIWKIQLLFTFILAAIVYAGARMVDRVNLVLMFGLISTYFAFIFFGLSHVHLVHLAESNWSVSLVAMPVIFTSFSYQGIIPSLATYLKRDARKIRIAIICGTTIAFAIYLLWEFLILGIVPLQALLEAEKLGQTAVAPLKEMQIAGSIVAIGQFFAFFAITTSFLGVTLGLFDFLADGLKMPKKGARKWLLSGLTFGPPLFISLLNPNLFIKALIFAGGIGCALLLGLLPILMVWKARYGVYRERLKNREMPRRRPEFESGEAGAEAAKLEKFSAGVPKDVSSLGWGAGGSQSLWLSDDGRTDSSITSGIDGHTSSLQLPGGKVLLSCLFLFVVLELAIEFLL